MRESEFWMRMSDEFGEAYAGVVAATQQVAELGDRTPDAALEAGLAPRVVWDALCDHMGIPAERRLGKDRPLRRGPVPD